MNKTIQALLLAILLIPSPIQAREIITEWYIKDLTTDIVVNADSSIDVIEYITADCGDLPDRHGIFRTLSTARYLVEGTVENPITLTSITDFSGKSRKYSTTTDSYNDTITWKIGDPNVTVTGVNEYLIKYHVDNAVIDYSEDFDEFYWNILGHWWDMEIDSFKATVYFPDEITQNNTEIYNYTGEFGGTESTLVDYYWINDNTIEFTATRPLAKYEGITTSITFPKGIVTPYVPPPPTWWETNGAVVLAIIYLTLNILSFIISIGALIFSVLIWNRHGRDPNLGKTIIAEYAPPDNLNPMQINMLMKFGDLDTRSITASIVNLAVKKYITITEIEEKGLIFKSKDYQLVKNEAMMDKQDQLDSSERLLYNSLFGGAKSVKISSLHNRFYKKISPIKDQVKAELMLRKIFVEQGFQWQGIMLALGIVMIVISFFLFFIPLLALNTLVGGIIILIFSFFMSKMTTHGAELLWQTKGFKLFMETAEKYRQQFNEKENLFEKLLPYAIAFNMVKQWIGKMKEIYGEEYMKNYHPAWYAGASSFAAFDIDSFSSNLSAMSSNMSSTMSSSPSSSGSGGGGFSGGGGGGGGGGGW
ncbi:MAG: DUF2207 domain-containing protein [Patescibacteria group bacterium]